MFEDNFREVKMGAIFHATLTDAITGEIVEECSAHNIILTNAYRHMAGQGGVPVDANFIAIGTGSSEPDKDQDGLDAFLAIKEASFSRDLVNPLKWYYQVYFASTEANGETGIAEIREIAIKWSDGPYLNRALFRDSDGVSPRTITKTSSQVLTVRMEFEIRRGTI